MQINISGHHVEVTPSLKEYVNKKINRLSSHYESITSVQVILSVEKLEHKAEVTLHVTGADINATSVSNDMYIAIDDVSDKLARQLNKYKGKRLSR